MNLNNFYRQLERLKTFQDYYGIKSPSRKDQNEMVAALGRWVHRTRGNYRSGSLDELQIKQLNNVGFEFDQNSNSLKMSPDKEQSYTRLLVNMIKGMPLKNESLNDYTILVKAHQCKFLSQIHVTLFEELIEVEEEKKQCA